MEIYKSQLTLLQNRQLNSLWERWGDNTIRSTEGNSSMLRQILTTEVQEEDLEILDWIHRELDFYHDISPTLVGEIVTIIMRLK